MSAPLRLLFVAQPADAAQALAAVREGGPVSALLAPTAAALQTAVGSDEGWDAVVVVPGGPVDDVEVAAYVPDALPLVVVAPEVPLMLTETSARPVPRHDLPALAAMLRGEGVPASVGVAEAPATPTAYGDGAASAYGDGTSEPAAPATLSFSPSAGTPGPPRPTSASVPPTPMLDFRFGRSAVPAPDPEPGPALEDRSPALTASSAPAADGPVFIVRARAEEAPPPPAPVAEAPPERVEVAAPSDEGRPAVLVVEDNNDTRMLLERILRSTYDVKAVGDARSALLAMNERQFSGLVLDINLGGKETGADVLRIARSLPGYGDVFAIALTAYALPGDRERLLAAGFDEYISKPFTRQSLMETLAAGVVA